MEGKLLWRRIAEKKINPERMRLNRGRGKREGALFGYGERTIRRSYETMHVKIQKL